MPGKKIGVEYGFDIKYHKSESGKYSCFIPGFKISFSVSKEEDIAQRSIALTRIFFDHFFIHSKPALKSLGLQLHKLGFKAPDDTMVIKKMIRNEAVKAKFKMPFESVPPNFSNASSMEASSELELSI